MPNKKKKKMLTLEQLIQFCEKSKLYTFNSNDTGYTLSVQVPDIAQFSGEVSSDKGMFYAPIRICHTLLNRNNSYISEKNMKRAMPSLKYRPFLAHIHKLDSGEWDFHSHDIELIENEDGEIDYEYIEKQIGCITADEPYLEYDEEMDKTYVTGVVAIPEEYTRGAEIIRNKKGSKVSCELTIESMEYNAKDKYLELVDFYFSGVTGLGREKDGTEIGEGMLGSRISLEDFSSANNSMFAENDTNTKIIELLESLNNKLDNFNINLSNEGENNQKGGNESVSKFEELLAKYSKTIEDVTFEYEGLSDEELEAKFAEAFGEEGTGENNGEDEGDIDPDVTPDDDGTEPKEPVIAPETEPIIVQNSLEPLVRTYEISHEDIRYSLYALLSSYEEADNEWYFINNVFDTYFTYENWNGDKVFGQAYAKDGDNISFNGERYNLHRELLTDSEYAELQSMRSNYSSIKEKADKYDYSLLEADRVAEFNKDEYKSISDKPEFLELSKEENHKDFSLDEVKSKLNDIILSYAKSGQLSFASVGENTKPQIKVTRLPMDAGKGAKRSRYGNLFSNKEN